MSVVRALSIQVKYLTIEHIARGWFFEVAEPQPKATQLVDSLVRSGLVVADIIEIYDIPMPPGPLFEWKPLQPTPAFEQFSQLAELLANRWSNLLRTVTIYQASREAANLFGASTVDSTKRSSDWSHDLFISDVFLRYRQTRKPDAANWLGESFVPKFGTKIKGMKDPDAFLLIDGRIERVVEIGGKYTAEHLLALHDHCAGGAFRRLHSFAAKNQGKLAVRLYDNKLIPYEIW